METSSRRSYTKQQSADAVADVPALGVSEAARKHGVPQTCLSRWAKDAGVRREKAPAPTSTRRPKATRKAKAKKARRSKAAAQVEHELKREEPVEPAPAVKATELPTRRTLKSRVAKVYTPSQKAMILESRAEALAQAVWTRDDFMMIASHELHADKSSCRSSAGDAEGAAAAVAAPDVATTGTGATGNGGRRRRGRRSRGRAARARDWAQEATAARKLARGALGLRGERLLRGRVAPIMAARACSRAAQQKDAADAELAAAFNDLAAAGLAPQANWDKADRLTWEILQAFDRSQFGD